MVNAATHQPSNTEDKTLATGFPSERISTWTLALFCTASCLFYITLFFTGGFDTQYIGIPNNWLLGNNPTLRVASRKRG